MPMMEPNPRIGRWSAYTVLGFAGYAVATSVATYFALMWNLAVADRIVALLIPPIAFICVVTIATALKGREWIVFYQVVAGGLLGVTITGYAAGADVARVLDVSVLGMGVFLAFGRIGCFRVACCHGRPSRSGRGVRYGTAHAAIGFWRRWVGRPLVPLQLIESLVSVGLVACGFVSSTIPGRAAVVYLAGYAVVRFTLEGWRGDPIRPHAVGLSEARWWSVLAVLVCAVGWPAWWTVACAVALTGAAIGLVVLRHRRELVDLRHLKELDDVASAVRADRTHASRQTSLGVAVSAYRLPDGRLDWVLSSKNSRWSLATATYFARMLWPDGEVIAGRTPGVIHILEPDAP